VKQIIRYVSGTLGHGCSYKRGNSELKLTGFSDSDHAGDLDDRKSTSGVTFFLGDSIITWTSQKQKSTAISSCEAKYMDASAAACQGLWLSRLIGVLMGKPPAKFMLWVDNKSAIALCKNPVHHDRSKHVDTRFHHIRECYEKNLLDIEHIGTNGQLADILTKALGKVRFIELRQKLGVMEIQKETSSLRG
jgi:hypothetical protein